MSGSVSAIDPAISLGIKPPAIPPSMFSGNILDSMKGLTEIQGQQALIQQHQLNSQQLQAKFSAHQEIGNIIANAPDLESGLALAARSAQSPWAADALQSLRATQKLFTEQQGTIAGQNRDAVQSFMKAASGALGNPDMLPNLLNANLQTLPPDLQKRVANSATSIVKALTDGLPAGDAAKPEFQKRLMGLMASSGMSPDAVSMQLGAPVQAQLGNRVQFGRTDPLSGGLVPGGAPQTLGLAPSVQTLGVGGGRSQPTVVFDPTGLSGSATGVLPGMGGNTGQGVAPPTKGMVGPQTLPGNIPLGLPSLTPSEVAAQTRSGTNIAEAATGADAAAAAKTGENVANAATGGAAAAALASGTEEGKVKWAREQAFATRLGGDQAQLQHAGQLTFSEMQGKNSAELEKEFNNDLTALPTALDRSNVMFDALSQFRPGGLANTREGIAKVMQGLQNAGVPISDKAVQEVGNSSLSANQIFNANVKPVMISQLRESSSGMGRVIKTEIDAFMSAMNAETDPTAILQLLNQARRTMQTKYDMAMKYDQFKTGIKNGDPSLAGKTLDQFMPWYANQWSPNNMASHNAAGTSIGPVSGENAIGVPGTTPPTASSTAGTGVPRGQKYYDPVTKSMKVQQ